MRARSTSASSASWSGGPEKRSAASSTRGRSSRSPTVFRNTFSWPRTNATATSISSWSVRGSYQVAVVGSVASPRPAGDRLDGLQRDVPLRADPSERFEVGPVHRIAERDRVARREHGVEREDVERAAVLVGHRQAVAGDADEADEPLVAGLERCLERPAGTERLLPLAGMDEVVQLDQVDRGDIHPVERAVDGVARRRSRPVAGLRREEERVAMLREPGSQLVLRVPVARGGVDVVDAVLEQQLEDGVRLGRCRSAERDGAEHDPRAHVPRPTERDPRDGHRTEHTPARCASTVRGTTYACRVAVGGARRTS